jgi:hypothetical protein
MSELTFSIPTQLNGEQLCKELNAEMVYINGDLLYIVGDLTQAQAAAGIAAHKPIPIPEPTIADKLASVGLSVADLKTALGL